MTHLRFSFTVHIDTWDLPSIVRPAGPLFNRWVPDGRRDGIELTAEEDTNQLVVWFERRAERDGPFLKWKSNGSAFDDEIMARQAKLDGGPLRGELLWRNLTADEMAAITSNPVELNKEFGQGVIELAPYVALGKRIVGFVQPRLSRFLEILRCQYGQYWIRTLEPWDSRAESLGSYCAGINLCWNDDTSGAWFRFLPTNLSAISTPGALPGRGNGEYLTEQDWRQLQSHRCLQEPSLEVQLLGRASRLLDQSEYRQAYVEAVSALELALSRRLSSTTQTPLTLTALQSMIDRTSLRGLAAAVLLASGFHHDDIEAVLQAVDTRNRVVHKGDEVDSSGTLTLRILMRVTAQLLGLAEFKSPVLYSGNSLAPPPPTEWLSDPRRNRSDA